MDDAQCTVQNLGSEVGSGNRRAVIEREGMGTVDPVPSWTFSRYMGPVLRGGFLKRCLSPQSSAPDMRPHPVPTNIIFVIFFFLSHSPARQGEMKRMKHL